jgi:hypothetical protein
MTRPKVIGLLYYCTVLRIILFYLSIIVLVFLALSMQFIHLGNPLRSAARSIFNISGVAAGVPLTIGAMFSNHPCRNNGGFQGCSMYAN